MEKYTIVEEVGSGSFGVVWKAMNKNTSEVVAIKMIKRRFDSWDLEKCMNLREVKSLRKMNHPNIVKLKELIKEKGSLYFVFEFMDCNLFQLIQKERMEATKFSEPIVRYLCFRVFHGLAHMHERGYFHRDLKPENLLVSNDGAIKIADLGLAREIDSKPPYTEYVVTRWYRAPEVMLGAGNYGPAIDMWSMGAIMAELFTLFPLFCGTNEADQMNKICSVLGTPTEKDWPEGLRLANVLNYKFPQYDSIYLPALIPSASPDAIDLIQSLCSWDPCKRPTAAQALQHAFFRSYHPVPAPLMEEIYFQSHLMKKQPPIQRPVVSDADLKLTINNDFEKPSQPLLQAPAEATRDFLQMLNREWSHEPSNVCAGRSEVMLPHKKMNLLLALGSFDIRSY